MNSTRLPDIRRRSFLFGAAAVVVIAPTRKYFLMPPRKEVILSPMTVTSMRTTWGFGKLGSELLEVSFRASVNFFKDEDFFTDRAWRETFKLPYMGDKEFVIRSKHWGGMRGDIEANYVAQEVRKMFDAS